MPDSSGSEPQSPPLGINKLHPKEPYIWEYGYQIGVDDYNAEVLKDVYSGNLAERPTAEGCLAGTGGFQALWRIINHHQKGSSSCSYYMDNEIR